MSQVQENPASLESFASRKRAVCDDETPCGLAFVVTSDGIVIEIVMLSRDGRWCSGDAACIGTSLSTLAWFAQSEPARKTLGSAIARCSAQEAVHEDIEVPGCDWRPPRVLAARLTAIEVNGSLRISGVLTDVTAARFLEEQLRSARKAERLGHAAVDIAREFNQLLSIIAAGPLLTRPDEASPLSDAARVRQSAVACERAERLARRLLAFSESDAAPRDERAHR